MTPFTTLHAPAARLPEAGIDTDQLIPARFMSRSRTEGYGTVLLHDSRFAADGAALPHPLNGVDGVAVLVARRNFGTGSSREAAVYALLDYGIRCVVAPSFGDIFAANAVNNGLLPARMDEAAVEALLAGAGPLRVDLAAQTVDGVAFAIDPVWRRKLLNGWTDLDLTLSHAAEIAAWAEADRQARAWAIPGPG